VRVLIITPVSPAHHKHFCVYLASRHDVVGVIHPAVPPKTLRRKLRRTRHLFSSAGGTLGTLRMLATISSPLIGWDAAKALAEGEQRYFADAHRDYEVAGLAAIAHMVDDVNGRETISLIRELDPQVVVCLGGPVYREPLIEACGTMINFHSGVSPLYNGSSTVMFAFANGHVHLCGGTLMTMSPIVDGGDILAHYLPEIVADDDPSTLFLRTVQGAATVTSEFLAHFSSAATFTSAPQTPPLFYTTSDAWTIHETHKVRRHLEQKTAARHCRPEETLSYWNLKSNAEATQRARATIERLLKLA
jgi:folate-dependent phosphoribosylglycinamide formyltransferase PurN